MRGCGITHAVGEPATSVTPTAPALLPRGGGAGGGSSSSATADRMFRLGLTESQSLQVRVESYLGGGGGGHSHSRYRYPSVRCARMGVFGYRYGILRMRKVSSSPNASKI